MYVKSQTLSCKELNKYNTKTLLCNYSHCFALCPETPVKPWYAGRTCTKVTKPVMS